MSNRQIRQYSASVLSDALKAVKNGMGVNKASRVFGVPRSIIQSRLKSGIDNENRRMGPIPFLTDAEEKKLVEWCIKLVKCGFPRKECDILNTVQQIVLDDKRPTPFKNGRPGKKWFTGFLKRNPELTTRTPEGLTKGRATVTEEFIRSWFKELEGYLAENNCLDILTDPNIILNGDETSFSLCPKSGKVIAPVGLKNVYTINMGSDKENLTVLLVFSAAGVIVPPMIVFPYKRPPRAVLNRMPADWCLGLSDSGWMRADTFHDYIVNGVHKWIVEHNITKPVLLLVDGHKSHLSMNLSEFCSNNGIILYALPPNTTHIMQPADVSVFKPLKTQWKKTVSDWLSLLENQNTMVTKITFCPLFKMVLDKITLKETIKNGFKRCGLYPFNCNAVDYTKCIQNYRENLQQTRSDSPINISQENINTTIFVLNKFQNKLEEIGINIDEIKNVITSSTENPIETRRSSSYPTETTNSIGTSYPTTNSIGTSYPTETTNSIGTSNPTESRYSTTNQIDNIQIGEIFTVNADGTLSSTLN